MKFYFIHKFFNNLNFACGLLKINCSKYNLEWPPTSPDILIASEHIYNYKPCFDEFIRLSKTAKIIVLFVAEAIEPDFNIADYVISYPILDYGERYVRLPIPTTLFSGMMSNRVYNLRNAELENKKEDNIIILNDAQRRTEIHKSGEYIYKNLLKDLKL